MKCFIALGLAVVTLSAYADTTIYEKQYDGFSVWLDCEKHGAVAVDHLLY